RDVHGVRDVARHRRRGPLVVEHTDRDAVAAEAARDAQALVVAPDHQRPRPAGGRPARPPARERPDAHRAAPGAADGAAHGAAHGPAHGPAHAATRTGAGGAPARARVSSRPVNQLPETNRIVGPKLRAAGAPTMCRPGT